jgi:hypothetical protein
MIGVPNGIRRPSQTSPDVAGPVESDNSEIVARRGVTSDDGVAETARPKSQSTVGEKRAAPIDDESVLLHALQEAANAGQWDVVRILGKELEARRLARAGNVVQLDAGRRRRER